MSLSTSSRVTVLRRLRNSVLRASSDSSSPSGVAAAVVDADDVEEADGIWILPTDDTNPTISIPWASLRYFSAMAPAATRPKPISILSK